MGKRELVALLCLSSWCLMIVVWLHLTMQSLCLQFVIVVFPGSLSLSVFGILPLYSEITINSSFSFVKTYDDLWWL